MIIATTRFNDVTVHENIKWCNENNFNGIIINTSCKSSSKIPFNSEVLVICMLNLDRIKNNGCEVKYMVLQLLTIDQFIRIIPFVDVNLIILIFIQENIIIDFLI